MTSTTKRDGGPQAAAFEPMGSGLFNLLNGLMDRAQANLTEADLRRVVDDGYPQLLASQIATVAEGIGLLVSSDADLVGSGALQQPRDVTQVFFLIANVAQLIDGLLGIQTTAANALAVQAKALHVRADARGVAAHRARCAFEREGGAA